MKGRSPIRVFCSAAWLKSFLFLAMGSTCLASEGNPGNTREPIQWSSLEGLIIVEGEVPKPLELDLGRDSCCIKAKPTDQSWIVGPRGELANVVVSLRTSSGKKIPLPTNEAIQEEPLVLTNRGCSFSPRILLLRSGQTLRIANEDPTTHNVAANLGRNDSFNLVLPPEDYRDLLMAQPERKPMPVSCNIHPYMRGYVSVRNDPYVAISDTEGKFAIDSLPTGVWEFQFWHEGRYLSGVKFSVEGEPFVTDTRGRVRLEVKPGKPLNLGEARLSISGVR